ncbi:hypothetical protein LROSL1_1182 [Furfurilactobacillus rossiae]|uniref:hypothetical protein n=1 Tax=Furfurilactobacillus rossiae TaxID=231049 RepID=UPI0015BBF57D|nr:hypothetical protein [Furfurilactobacillus rossiae]QLE63999.1 hypothetical protein LROSL1_1182 [Furfurilactobacillus rossiae]
MHFWGIEIGSWAEWFGAVGTIGAVVTTMFLQHRQGKVRIKVNCKTNYSVPEMILLDYVIEAINVGPIPTEITAAGFLLSDKRHIGFYHEKYPVRLEQEESHEFKEKGQAILATAQAEHFSEKFSIWPYVRNSRGQIFKTKRIKISQKALAEALKPLPPEE